MLSQIKHQYSDRKVFLGGLAWSTTEDSLKEYLERELNITVEKVTIMRDRQTGNSRGFGFVIVQNADDADKVVNANHLLDSKKIEAKRAIPKDEIQESNTRKLFVGGIPVNITDDEFKNHFIKFGTVTEIQIVKDRNTGKSRGFGFVTFEDKDNVDHVLTFPHVLLGKQVEVKKAEPKKSTPTNELQYGSDAYISSLFGYPPFSSGNGQNQKNEIQEDLQDSNLKSGESGENDEYMNQMIRDIENLSFEESPRSMNVNQGLLSRSMVSPRKNTNQIQSPSRIVTSENVLENQNSYSENLQPNIKRSKSMEHLKAVGSRPFSQNDTSNPSKYSNNTPPPPFARNGKLSLFSIEEEPNAEEDITDQYSLNHFISNQYSSQFSNGQSYGFSNTMFNQYLPFQYPNDQYQFTNNQFAINGLYPNNQSINYQYSNNQYHTKPVYNNTFTPIDPNLYIPDQSANFAYSKITKRNSWSGRLNSHMY
jgi:RNA recognition motif-containing protein